MGMRFLLLFATLTSPLLAQLADGPGMAETEKNCKGCHEVERSVSLRQDKGGWNGTLTKMVGFGMKAKESDLAIIADYLAKYYPADSMPPLNINTAAATELESRLGMRRSQAAAFIEYREKNGKFKTIAELKQAPGIDPAKIESKKTEIIF